MLLQEWDKFPRNKMFCTLEDSNLPGLPSKNHTVWFSVPDNEKKETGKKDPDQISFFPETLKNCSIFNMS